MRVDPEALQVLKELKIHPNESVSDVILRLAKAKGSLAEADVFESARDRFERYLALREAEQDEIEHEKFLVDLEKSKIAGESAARKLGFYAKDGETVPPLGLGRHEKKKEK